MGAIYLEGITYLELYFGHPESSRNADVTYSELNPSIKPDRKQMALMSKYSKYDAQLTQTNHH